MTSNIAPAHPHATRVAVYPALFLLTPLKHTFAQFFLAKEVTVYITAPARRHATEATEYSASKYGLRNYLDPQKLRNSQRLLTINELSHEFDI